MLHHFHAEPLLNYGVVQTYLPDEILEVLKAEAKEIQDSFDTANPYNKKLAGNIEKEFTLEKSGSVLKPFILDMATFYTENFKLFNTWKPVFQKPWINFMKKHEFNPIHFHVPLKGLSYVIWVQIPYDPAEEKALPHSVNANQPMSSNFQFVYIFFDILYIYLFFDTPFYNLNGTLYFHYNIFYYTLKFYLFV